MVKGLRRTLESQRDLYLNQADKILFIVVEDYYDERVFRQVFQDYSYNVVVIPRIERPGQDYPLDSQLLKGKTLGWLITNISATHSPSTRKLFDRKMFVISNPGITPDWGAVLDPKNRGACQRSAEAILSAIGGDVGGTFRITAEDGTDLRLRVPRGNWFREIGERSGSGTNGPYGECGTAPYWAEGIYVLKPGDFATNPINEVASEIRLTIYDNHVVEVTGGKQARALKKMLDEANNPKAYSLGEFSFGINPGEPRKLYRSVIAEKLLGGIHIAIGTNALCLGEACPEINRFPYGRYFAGVHIDCIKFGATVAFCKQGRRPATILEKGILKCC